MRTMLLVAGVVAWSAVVRAEPPPIDDAIKTAAAAKKPLVVEFSAEWCEPCKEFERTTLKDLRVEISLRDVLFVRYDAENGNGIGAASRYSINSFPTFVVIDAAGKERARRRGAMQVEPFIEFLDGATMAVVDVAKVRADAKAKRDDARVQMTAARWFIDNKLPAEAAESYRAVAANRTAPKAMRAEANAAVHRQGRLARWRKELVDEKAALIRDAAELATLDDLVIATVDSGLPAKQIRELVHAFGVAHLRDAPRQLQAFVPVALASGAADDALEAAKSLLLVHRDAWTLLMISDCYRMRGELEKARAYVDEMESFMTEPSAKQRLAEIRTRLATNTSELPAITQLKLRVGKIGEQLVAAEKLPAYAPEPLGVSSKSDRWMKFYRALDSTTKAVGKACAKYAGSQKLAFVRVTLESGKPKTTVALLDANAPKALRDCLVKEASAADYAEAPTSHVDLEVELASTGAAAGLPF